MLEAIQFGKSLSYGAEAERIARAEQASKIAYLASVTSFLFRTVADRNEAPAADDAYLARARRLSEILTQIDESQAVADERTLRYRQLMPRKLWTEATANAEGWPVLLKSIPTTLAQLERGQVEPAQLRMQAGLLDAASARFTKQVAEEFGRLGR